MKKLTMKKFLWLAVALIGMACPAWAEVDHPSLVCYVGDVEMYSFYLNSEPTIQVQGSDLLLSLGTVDEKEVEAVIPIADDLRFAFEYRDYQGVPSEVRPVVLKPFGEEGAAIVGEGAELYTLDGKKVTRIDEQGIYIVKTAKGTFKISKR